MMTKVMEHFDQVYNKLTEQIGQKWMTGRDPEVIVSAVLWESWPPKKLCLNANTVRTVSEHHVLKTTAVLTEQPTQLRRTTQSRTA